MFKLHEEILLFHDFMKKECFDVLKVWQQDFKPIVFCKRPTLISVNVYLQKKFPYKTFQNYSEYLKMVIKKALTKINYTKSYHNV